MLTYQIKEPIELYPILVRHQIKILDLNITLFISFGLCLIDLN